MIRTTQAQRRAIKRVYDRGPILPYVTPREQDAGIRGVPITYRQFRRGARPTFGCDGAVALQWAGMWLCIERDGYTHS